MFARPHIEQTDPRLSPKETLPTMYDLPSENSEEPGLPDEYHIWQSQLLSFGCQPPTYPLDQVFVASDLKWDVYERILGVPYYVVFDRYTDQLQVFQLEGNRYKELALTKTEPRIWIAELELGLGLWSGEYQGVSWLWLRWYDAQGNCVLTEAKLNATERSRPNIGQHNWLSG